MSPKPGTPEYTNEAMRHLNMICENIPRHRKTEIDDHRRALQLHITIIGNKPKPKSPPRRRPPREPNQH